MPESNVTPEKSKLCRIIEENLPGAAIVAGARRHFREDLGMEYINQVISVAGID
jgi:DNA mismatch repair protein MSH4